MPYTLWHNNQLIGQTDFELRGHAPKQRAGVFRPDPAGLALVPAIAGVHRALFEFERMAARRKLSEDEMIDAMGTTPEGMRVVECGKVISELQLRDDWGNVVAYETVALLDLTQFSKWQLRNEARALAKKKHHYMISATMKYRDLSLQH